MSSGIYRTVTCSIYMCTAGGHDYRCRNRWSNKQLTERPTDMYPLSCARVAPTSGSVGQDAGQRSRLLEGIFWQTYIELTYYGNKTLLTVLVLNCIKGYGLIRSEFFFITEQTLGHRFAITTSILSMPLFVHFIHNYLDLSINILSRTTHSFIN